MDKTLEDLKSVILSYLDALHRSDAALLASVFHDKALYASTTGGDIRFWSMEHYLPIVAARPAPASRGEVNNGRIVSITIAGADAAVAIVEMTLLGRDFTDILSFVREDGRWRIAAKVFDSTPAA
ncbi:nuclear transport factor 2 family protein [Microvirga tunisiensis]|uniref:Nuclear transport factor 2 family protein n=1 Tax=Pannonibacter tanglangensis TaxID=2750084 RepID=A0A7X5F1V3_9HYPH|nr:nuclear transport factor 2 family protein [Pannonibacter sp. XCT-53]NBN78248.1 nuclear transport factor 2 family protein [Pannonibacter sp. XCT-53]